MRLFFIIMTLCICSASFGQKMACDTLFLLNGEKIAVNIQDETSFNYTYILCCDDCAQVRKVQKKNVQEVYLSPTTKIELIQKKEEPDTLAPFTINIELGGQGVFGGMFFEYFPKNTLNRNLGIRTGLGYFDYFSGVSYTGINGLIWHGSIVIKAGKHKSFLPSFGISRVINPPQGGIKTFVTNFYSIQKHTSFGNIRINPGILITGDIGTGLSITPIPWLGIGIGFNL